MLKNILLISLLSSLTLGLTACGNDTNSKTTNNTEDADKDADKDDCGCSGSTDDVKDDGNIADDEIAFTEVAKKTDSDTQSKYIVRTDIFFKTGQAIQEVKTPLVGELAAAEMKKATAYRLAPNYYSAKTFRKASETTKVETLDDGTKKFMVDIIGQSENNQEKSLTFSNEIAILDISGVTKDSTTYTTALSSFGLVNTVFPDGSKCTVYKKFVNSFPHFKITVKNKIVEASIDEWFTQQKSKRTDIIGQQEMAVGANNEHKVVYLKLQDDTAPAPALINFYGKLYETNYSQQTQRNINIDPTIDTVVCNGYNKVAADYLEEEITANVTLADLNK